MVGGMPGLADAWTMRQVELQVQNASGAMRKAPDHRAVGVTIFLSGTRYGDRRHGRNIRWRAYPTSAIQR